MSRMQSSDDLLSTVMLWMNSGCNARCVMCEIWKERTGAYLSAEEIEEWAAGWRAAGVRLVELCGEPTIHPQLREISRAIRASGLEFSLLSNGLRLGRWIDVVAEAKSLTVSLDGPPALHDRIRAVPNAFARLERNVADIRRARADLPIFGRCVVHRLNFEEMSETVNSAKALGLNSISFFGLDSDTQAFGREARDPGDWTTSIGAIALREEDMPRLAEELGRLAALHAADFESGFIVERPARLGYCLSPHQRREGGGVVRCNAPFTSAVIEPDGSVKPCWFLPAYGNIREAGGLEQVLGSLAAKDALDSLDVGTHPVCNRCITPRIFSADGSSRSGLPEPSS